MRSPERNLCYDNKGNFPIHSYLYKNYPEWKPSLKDEQKIKGDDRAHPVINATDIFPIVRLYVDSFVGQVRVCSLILINYVVQ